MAVDWGGVISLIVTLMMFALCYYGMRKKLRITEYLTESGSVSKLIITLALMTTSVIAIWLAIRAGGVFIQNYLFIEKYRYTQYDILEMISYILIANLSLGLVRNLRKETRLQDIAFAAIQSVLIGIIIFLPKSSAGDFLFDLKKNIEGVIGYFLILLSIAIILIAITIFYERLQRGLRNSPPTG